jgi:hydrogenase nickel incorporation protein HypA/HybF
MHETGLVADLIHRIEAVARDQGGRRVLRVAVWLGAFSHLSAEHFTEHFRAAAAGTAAEGAALDIEVSADTGHADAQHLVLQSLEVEL